MPKIKVDQIPTEANSVKGWAVMDKLTYYVDLRMPKYVDRKTYVVAECCTSYKRTTNKILRQPRSPFKIHY